MALMLSKEESHELLQSHAHVWNHIFNFINSMALKCAVQLAIPDTIHSHGQPMTLSELVIALRINPARTTHVGRLMRLLVHSGFFALQKSTKTINGDKEEGYVLTPSCRFLLKGTETTVAPFLLMMLDPVLSTPWHFLSTWFLGNDPTALETAHGTSLWDLASQNPEINSNFNEAMASDARLAMSIVTKECGPIFHGVQSLVDVGGGNGTTAEAIADAFPHVQCTVYDLPHVVATVPKSNKIRMVGGDMFESIPSADTIFLKWILHDWTDEECVKILRRCKEAIPARGGKVILLEIVVNENSGDHKAVETQLFFDLLMMMGTHGRERNEDDWQKIFIDAGFTRYKFTAVLGMRSIIEVYP